MVKPGGVNGDIVSNVDFAETFLDIAGASVPTTQLLQEFECALFGAQEITHSHSATRSAI